MREQARRCAGSCINCSQQEQFSHLNMQINTFITVNGPVKNKKSVLSEVCFSHSHIFMISHVISASVPFCLQSLKAFYQI